MAYDNVDRPSHYAEGRAFEVIDVLEDWCGRAPDPVLGGLQWNSLKYQGRLWDKTNPLEDAKKSRWYLNRLIEKLEAQEELSNAHRDVVSAEINREVFNLTYEDVLEDDVWSKIQEQSELTDVDDAPLDHWVDSSEPIFTQDEIDRLTHGQGLWDPNAGPSC